MIDFVRYNEALTVAMRVLDGSGNARHAATLRTDSPELMRLARAGALAHGAGREPQPTTDIVPKTDTLIPAREPA